MLELRFLEKLERVLLDLARNLRGLLAAMAWQKKKAQQRSEISLSVLTFI